MLTVFIASMLLALVVILLLAYDSACWLVNFVKE